MLLVVLRKKKLYALAAVLLALVVFAVVWAAMHSNWQTASQNESRYLIMIYIEEKKLYLFQDDKPLKEYLIASGKSESPSPIGEWKIIGKDDWGEGFGGYWLGLNVPWGKYGIHGTTKEYTIGHNASHGCIRMYKKDIKELYSIVPVGTKVIIRNGPFGPFGMGFRNLLPGDRGADVLAIQKRLKELGYYRGNEDGIYGDGMKKAVHTFQKDRNLRIDNAITYDDYLAMGFEEIAWQYIGDSNGN